MRIVRRRLIEYEDTNTSRVFELEYVNRIVQLNQELFRVLPRVSICPRINDFPGITQGPSI